MVYAAVRGNGEEGVSGLYEMLKPDFMFRDARGELVQLVHTGYEQVNVLASRAGTIRGGHYHKHSREAFYVISGSVALTFRRDGRQEQRTFYAGEFFLIHPYVVHSMDFSEDCVLVGLYDHCVEGKNGEKDIFTE